MKASPETIRLALKLLFFMGVALVGLAAFLIYRNPDGMGGYLTACFAALQLVISKVGEAIRAGKNDGPDGTKDDPINTDEVER